MRLFVSPAVVAFASGAAVLAVELLVPRLVARHVGTSVAVWTATISVVLAGLAAGAWAGGRLADRVGARKTQAVFLLLAAPAVAAAPWIEAGVAPLAEGWPLVPAALALVAASSFLPALLLGGLGPAAAKEETERSPVGLGRALGRVGAAGAAGGFVGILATGFALIPSFSTSAGLSIVAALVAVVGAAKAVARDAAPAAVSPASARRRSRLVEGRDAAEPPARHEGEGIAVGAAAGIAFAAGAAFLVVEVCALRRAALILGAGLYTWTGVLFAVLVGCATGNAIGGRLADRIGARAAVARLLVASAALSMLAAWTPSLLAWTAGLAGLPYGAAVVVGSCLAWGAPAAALAALPPALGRAALASGGSVGGVVGRVSAAGTAGAVLAGVLASPLLLPALGHGGTLAATALVLALVASAVRRRVEWPWTAAVAVALLAASLPFPWARAVGTALSVRDDRDGVVVFETPLQHVRVDSVARTPVEGRRVRRMRLDALVHGSIDLDDPTWTGFGYEGIYAAVTERAEPADRAPRALFLGGGPYAFPRWLLAKRPEASVVVAEIDAGVTRAAQEALGLADPLPFEVAHEDARTYVHREAGRVAPFDLVYGDAFHGCSVPWHLTTVEFAREVKAAMAEDGVYLVNVIDVFDEGRFVGAFLATLRRVFAHVTLTSLRRDDATLENFVLVASDREVDLSGLRRPDPLSRDGKTIPVARYGPFDLEALWRRSGDLVLTDDFAPVDNLLARVAARR